MNKEVVRKDHPIVQKKINRSLRASVREGVSTSISKNLSLSYFSPAALALNATNVQMGILQAIVSLLPSLSQLKTASLIEKYERKKIVLSGIVGKILLLVPIFLAGYLYWIGVPYMVWFFIGLVGLHYILTSIQYPAWFSWMGSLVPENERGKYFSYRNRIVGFFGVLTMIVAALLLDWTKRVGSVHGDVVGFTLLGFGIIFLLSGIFRIISFGILKTSYEPRLKIRKKDHFSFVSFLRHAKETPFGRFSLFAGIFAFAYGIAAPYWTVYMLRDLGLSYIWYIAIIVSAVIFQLIFLPLLGKFSDNFGNVQLIRTCSLAVSVVPFFWVASFLIKNPLVVRFYLLLVPSVISGFGWAGYNLGLNNYIYDSVSNQKQGHRLSYINSLVCIGGFLGAGFGAMLAWINVSFMNSMLFIFMISGIARLIFASYGSGFLREVRVVKKFDSHFWIREFAPAQGFVREFHNIGSFAQRVEHYVVPRDKKKFEKEKAKMKKIAEKKKRDVKFK